MAAILSMVGRLISILPKVEGDSANGHWVRQSFVVEVLEGNFTSNVCFDAWGENSVNALAAFKTGDTVNVSFRPSSREFNGKWYTSLRAWRIVSETEAGATASQQENGVDPEPAVAHIDTAPSEEAAEGGAVKKLDDLPF